jgi:DNA-directed RNA polymerase specialized sigma24 family protein
MKPLSVEMVLARLKLNERQVLIMRDIERLGFAEIAKAMGSTEKVAKMLYRSTRDKARKIATEMENHETE